MTRFLLFALFSFLVAGMATAQPPVDYVLQCDEDVIGVVSLVDGELHAAMVAGETCAEGVLIAVVGDEEFTFSIDIDDHGVVTITVFLDLDDVDGMSATAVVVPQEAIAGMLTAQVKRAAAMERATLARERRPELPDVAADEADEADEATEAQTEPTPELPDMAMDEADEATEERGARPTLPDVAADEAREATDRRGEGRPTLPDVAADEASEATEERGEGRPALPEANPEATPEDTEERGEDRPELPKPASDRRP